MRGDGNCLFHALGFLDSVGGETVRGNLADYMVAEAVKLDPAEASIWTDEAEALRHNIWGGHTAIAAYSLMTHRRIIMHRRLEHGNVHAVVVSHGSIPDGADVQHVLYSDGNHYDALLEIHDARGLTPAWEQPGPPQYFVAGRAEAERKDALASGAAHQPRESKARFAVPRPKQQVSATAGRSRATERKGGAKAEFAKGKHPWYKAKTTPAPELHDDIAAELARVPVCCRSAHPHRAQEDLIKELDIETKN